MKENCRLPLAHENQRPEYRRQLIERLCADFENQSILPINSKGAENLGDYTPRHLKMLQEISDLKKVFKRKLCERNSET